MFDQLVAQGGASARHQSSPHRFEGCPLLRRICAAPAGGDVYRTRYSLACWLDSSVERTPRHEQRARPPGDCDRRRGATRLAELNWKKLDVFGC